MSICDSGFGQKIEVMVPDTHELIVLANQLPWEKMLNLVEHDQPRHTI